MNVQIMTNPNQAHLIFGDEIQLMEKKKSIKNLKIMRRTHSRNSSMKVIRNFGQVHQSNPLYHWQRMKLLIL